MAGPGRSCFWPEAADCCRLGRPPPKAQAGPSRRGDLAAAVGRRSDICWLPGLPDLPALCPTPCVLWLCAVCIGSSCLGLCHLS